MICCGHCGARNFKAEREATGALRGAACHDLPAETQKTLRVLADDLSGGIDWRAVAVALCVKYGGAKGQALVGGGTVAWARDRVTFRVEGEGDAVRLRWDAPALNELPGERCK